MDLQCPIKAVIIKQASKQCVPEAPYFSGYEKRLFTLLFTHVYDTSCLLRTAFVERCQMSILYERNVYSRVAKHILPLTLYSLLFHKHTHTHTPHTHTHQLSRGVPGCVSDTSIEGAVFD